MNIIDKVREVNPEAADYLEETKNDNKDYSWDQDTLLGLMIWDETPQGHKYWQLISEKLGK